MNNKKRIGFVGPYSTANFGDYAILVNNIYDLGCNDIVIFTYNPRFPRVSLEEYCLGIKIKYVEVKLTNDSQLHTNKSGERYFLTPLDALTRLENRNEVYEAIESIDILIISGGGWLNHFWAERLDKLFKIMIPVYVASQKQKKIVFTANGYGPFDETRELYRYFFAYIKDAKIAVRDKYCSLSHLLEVGIDGRSVYYLPDDLYLINPQLLQKELHQQTKQRDYIVIEMFYPLEKLKEYEQQLISFSKKIYQRYGLSIVLLPFDLVQYGSDQAKYLDNIFDKSELYDIDAIGYLPIQDAYKIIKNAKMMITSRYHGLVLSLSAGTPVIFRLVDKMGDLRYSYNKGFGMLRAALEGLEFCEADFLQWDLIEILSNVEDNLEKIIYNQKEIYSKQRYKENKNKLKELRVQYFQDIYND